MFVMYTALNCRSAVYVCHVRYTEILVCTLSEIQSHMAQVGHYGRSCPCA